MCTYGLTFYVCAEGCFYNRDKVPGHFQKVRCFPCDAAVDLAIQNGIIWESLPLEEDEPFCCPRGSAMSEETMDLVVQGICEDCFAELSSSDEENGEEEEGGEQGGDVNGVEGEDDEAMVE